MGKSLTASLNAAAYRHHYKRLFYRVNLDQLVLKDDFFQIPGPTADLCFGRHWNAHIYRHTGRSSVDLQVSIKLLPIAYLGGVT